MRIHLTVAQAGAGLWAIHDAKGRVIVNTSRIPIPDACRAMLATGAASPDDKIVYVWDGSPITAHVGRTAARKSSPPATYHHFWRNRLPA